MSRPVLDVIDAGLFGSVQDLGRPGLQRQGVSEGGALDPRALFEGAALLNQAPDLAALEMTLVGGTFRAATAPVRVALTGAAFAAHVDGLPVPWRSAFTLQPGETLQVGKAQSGVYGYLNFAGGLDVPAVLGSRSTHLRAGFGGIHGRQLRAGDRLVAGATAPADAPADADNSREFDPARPPLFGPPPGPPRAEATPIRVLWGVHAEEFEPAERARLLATTFKLAAKRDRMGVALDGALAPFRPARGLTLISDAVVVGDVQVPGDGQPLVLLADRQPTGGYPRIATVITADLAAFAQLPSGSAVRFELVETGAAVAALRALRAQLDALPKHVRRRATRDELRTHNLTDGVYAGDLDA